MALKQFSSKEISSSNQIKNRVAIAAGKGGVGKSSVTVHLALALKLAGYAVGIMDTDVYGPSIRKMLPEDRTPVQKGEIIIPALCQGIKMISMAYFRREGEAAVVRAPIANGIISQFINNVEWGPLDFLLIDFPPGTGDVQLTLSQQANLTGALLVTTPQEVALLDVRKALHMFLQVKVPILGIIENMSYYYHAKTDEKVYLFGQGGGERLASESGFPFLGQIPIDPELCRAGDLGLSIFNESYEKNSPTAKIYLNLAQKLVEQTDHLKHRQASPIRNFWQNDPYHMTFEWSDGFQKKIKLSNLQKNCPCAGCTDEKRCPVSESLEAVKIQNVGNYAVRFQFNSGCSKGIYTFSMLRDFCEV